MIHNDKYKAVAEHLDKLKEEEEVKLDDMITLNQISDLAEYLHNVELKDKIDNLIEEELFLKNE